MLSRPFLWDHVAEHHQLQPDERRVLEEAREAGLKHGMSVPAVVWPVGSDICGVVCMGLRRC
ncbi:MULTISPECIES: autoinducer binding domain-containing protein [unclassified Bradyrhizobium]